MKVFEMTNVLDTKSTARNIHPSAIIDPAAKIGEGVHIGPYVIIGPDVTLGDHVKIHPHVVIDGKTSIGEGCEIFSFASIGSASQDKKYKGGKPELHIGKNNIIREYVTMNPGTDDGAKTIVGDNGLFMIGAHIAHDCIVGNNVILANNATLGGHVEVGDFAIIGGMSAVHQFVRIGESAIIGGMSGVENDVIPYGRVKDERAFLAGLNLIGLERRGASKTDLKTMQRAFNIIFGDKGVLDQRIDRAEEEFKDNPLITQIIDFARDRNKFPLCQPKKK